MGHHLEFAKERVEPSELVDFLHHFLAGAQTGEQFVLQIGELHCAFPADVLERSAIDLEYEHDVDKTELEITVEWRHEPAPTVGESTSIGDEAEPVGEEPVAVVEAIPAVDGAAISDAPVAVVEAAPVGEPVAVVEGEPAAGVSGGWSGPTA